MIIGMDVEIEPRLVDWRTDLEERGVIIRKKPGQIINTFDNYMLLGTPTPLPEAVVKRGLTKAFNEVEERVRKDELGVYDQRLHSTEDGDPGAQ